jgi:glucose/arabinose dehydrogenase
MTLVRILVLACLFALAGGADAASAGTVPAGFTDSVAITGLTDPTAIRFSPDGRVFIAEKSGLIKVFDGVSDPTATVFADLRTNVHNYWGRGLLGLALDPAFPAKPYVYVLYTYDHILGSSAPPPRWGTPGGTSDGCPSPPGPTADGCVVSGRLSRLQASGSVMTGAENVLIEGWCQQFPDHSIGSVAFGADGALYVTGGEGASFNYADYGQTGNPCGDPPGGVGATLTPPTAEGGALRAQDLRTLSDPVGLSGALLRVNPDTGAALADNPLAASGDANADRIVAHGFRNPFRIAVRPGTSDVWIGDVGWATWEEIDRVPNPTGGVLNFGWPCYEGAGRVPGYDSVNLAICENLYAQPTATTTPLFSYPQIARVVPGETCPLGSSSVTGLAFSVSANGPYPPEYDGALFFADYSRNCIWVMLKGGDNLPNPSAVRTFVTAASSPVDLQISPGGDLYYVDLDGGTVHRVRFTLTLDKPAVTPPPAAGPCTVTGTPGNDLLKGTPGRDIICGLGGNDVIKALGGDDVILAGPGNDRVDAGPGNDKAFGGAGNDDLRGGNGNDRITGEAGKDRLDGGAGADVLDGGTGSDVITGARGRDRLIGGFGNDRFNARDNQRDIVDGGRGRDTAQADRSPRDTVRHVERSRRR